jgi:hypothetical protein
MRVERLWWKRYVRAGLRRDVVVALQRGWKIVAEV